MCFNKIQETCLKVTGLTSDQGIAKKQFASFHSYLLAPTGALIVMMVYYTAYNFLNFHSAH